MINLTWVEVSKNALKNNLKQFRELVGTEVLICPCVKANAYGHGLVECGKVFLEGGADWLGVNSFFEAKELREAGIDCPIYVLGYVGKGDLAEAGALGLRMVAYNREIVAEMGRIDEKFKIHLKIETGNNRQGIAIEDVDGFVEYVKSFDNVEIEGICTHFANIEDTTDHSFAEKQLELFRSVKLDVPIRHCANSAATILFKKTHFGMVRPGIACYGMWPSKETHLSYGDGNFELEPALTWKCLVAQVKEVKAGESVGYGCTYKTARDSVLAILPVGYYDGYDRAATDGYVLIKGQRAPICGRICMNIMMVDITDIEGVELEDEVVLIGRDGHEEISAELFAQWAGTINYEVTTRINERVARKLT
ncbi:alanine racemase [Candidatus Gracilibacteria bacterium]|nr:alanine racemase [Candidatus Gracilibacteria bacterium]